MELNGIDFGRAWNAAGARNFTGEGYRAHRLWGPLRPRWYGSTFVAKTTTVEPRVGNMPLDGTEPAELVPKCIKVNFRKAAVLNAVGLSGPGVEALLATGRWQTRLEPFFLSFMDVQSDPRARIAGARHFARRVGEQRPRFRAPFGVQLNFSCPNVGLDPAGLIGEVRSTLLAVAEALPGVPLVPKFNALVPVDAAAEAARCDQCAAVCVSNTIPWGAAPGTIDWRGLFGETSPLAFLGGGGLSGAPIYPLVRDWVSRAAGDFPVPIVAGGGVVSATQARELLSLGASAIELGSVAIVRPWRVAGIIRAINVHTSRGRTP